MRAVVQRVSEAQAETEAETKGSVVASISTGLLVVTRIGMWTTRRGFSG